MGGVETATRRVPSGAKPAPVIREHRVPTPGSAPYICVPGPDGHLWFCESGASKIGRFDPNTATFTEFPLPTPNATPIGIITGSDGNLWFAEKSANQIGRISPRGKITEFPLPTPKAGPDAMPFFINASKMGISVNVAK